MSDYIKNVALETEKLDWAFPFQRTGAFPLDRSSLFSSYEDAALYAAGEADSRGLSGSSYIGQPISVYDKETNTVSLYVINGDKTLKEAGSALLADETSIEIIDGKIQLKDFGTGYYAYVPAVKNENGEIVTPSRHTYTTGFKAGLEPRIIEVTKDGVSVFEIAWYESGTETIEDAINRIEGLDKEVSKKADASQVYTKTETEALIAAAPHLKRKIVENVNEIDLNAADAEQYIYMVRIAEPEINNLFDEYIVLEAALEKVGSWEIDLSDYVTKDSLATTLTPYAKSEDLNSYLTIAAAQPLLNNKVDKVENYSLVADTEITKLATVKANAEPNYIKGTTSNFQVSTAGELSLVSITSGQVSDLQRLLDAKVDAVTTDGVAWTLLSPENQEKLAALVIGDNGLEISGKVNADNVEGLDSWIVENRNEISGLYPLDDQNKLLNIQEGAQVNYIKSVEPTQMTVTNGVLSLSKEYVETSLYISEVGDLTKLNRISGKENSTLVDEINDINTRLQWQELSE